jgi:hypothetical protein
MLHPTARPCLHAHSVKTGGTNHKRLVHWGAVCSNSMLQALEATLPHSIFMHKNFFDNNFAVEKYEIST